MLSAAQHTDNLLPSFPTVEFADVLHCKNRVVVLTTYSCVMYEHV